MSHKGVLWKWTNYWTGWQPRYFILEDGILSYYKSEEEVTQGCKGSVCVSACDISVHATDNLRLDICIPNEALQIYVRAASPTERQQWLVALGSTKAQGLDSRTRKSSEPPQDTIKTKRSELKLYATLLMQTVHSIKETSNSPSPDINKLDEQSSLLSATCDTFIRTLDDCVRISNATAVNTYVSPNSQTVVPVLHAKNKCITHSNSN